jgi:hypothetical protein
MRRDSQLADSNDPSKIDPQALRAEIGREVSRLAVEAGRKVVAGKSVDEEWARIDALQKIEAALPPAPSRLFLVTIVIGALCLIVASIAWTVRVSSTRVQLDVVTDTVSMQIASDLDWTGSWRLQPASVRLEHFSHFDLPDQYDHQPELKPGASLDLMAPTGDIHLTHLLVSSGALMTLARDEIGATDIVARAASFRGDIDVTGDLSIQAHPPIALSPRTFAKSDPPGRFGFQFTAKTPDGKAVTAIPAVLHGQPIDMPVFRDITVSQLGFFEERADGTQTTFSSQIISGTLTLTDTDERITLGPAAALRLSRAEGLVSAVKITEKGIEITFEGTSRDVTLGTGVFERDVTPSWLEWLFHQQKLGFLWTAVTFLFGLLWSSHKLLRE